MRRNDLVVHRRFSSCVTMHLCWIVVDIDPRGYIELADPAGEYCNAEELRSTFLRVVPTLAGLFVCTE